MGYRTAVLIVLIVLLSMLPLGAADPGRDLRRGRQPTNAPPHRRMIRRVRFAQFAPQLRHKPLGRLDRHEHALNEFGQRQQRRDLPVQNLRAGHARPVEICPGDQRIGMRHQHVAKLPQRAGGEQRERQQPMN